MRSVTLTEENEIPEPMTGATLSIMYEPEDMPEFVAPDLVAMARKSVDPLVERLNEEPLVICVPLEQEPGVVAAGALPSNV